MRVPGVPGWVTSSDAVVFEEAQNGNAPEDNYEMFFDGSDVGLTTRSEQIDSLSLWETGPFAPNAVALPSDCTAGMLFISTAANYRVPAAEGGALTGRGGDVPPRQLTGEAQRDDLAVVVQLIDRDGAVAAGWEGPPVAWHPTSAWQAGDLLRSQSTLRLPATVPDGAYSPVAALFDPATGKRLSVAGQGRGPADRTGSVS